MADRPEEVDADVGLVWSKVDAILDGFFLMLPDLLMAVVAFILVVLAGRILGRMVRRMAGRRRHEDLGRVFSSLTQWVVTTLAVLVSVTILFPSVKPVDLLTTLGVGSVAIGFAFKEILQNLLAGMLILMRGPFRIGDQIIVGRFEGTVEHVDARATLLKTYDGRRVVIPNTDVYTTAVIVNTAFDRRRTEVEVGIAYADDLAEARRAILAGLSGIDGILSQPAPDILATAFNPSWMQLQVRWWTAPDRTTVLRVRDRALVAIKRSLNEAGIRLPHEIRVVQLPDLAAVEEARDVASGEQTGRQMPTYRLAREA